MKATRLVVLATLALVAAAGLSGPAVAAPAKPVSVYPAPKTPVASDTTTFSFRGLKPGKLGKVKVVGSKTGQVGHTRLRHSDKRGVSIVPKRAFVPGERVRVFTKKRIKLTRNGDFWVRIGQFYGSDDADLGPGTPLPKDGLKSRPELKPPGLDVLASTPDAAPGKFLLSPRRDGLMIADNQGRLLYYRPTGFGTKGSQNFNFQAKTWNGKPVLTYWKGSPSAVGFSQLGNYEVLDDKYNLIAKFTPGNGYGANIHDFQLTDRGTAIVQAYRGVRYDLSPVGGPTDGKIFDNVVQEVDVKTGAVLFEWHALGTVGLKASETDPPEDGSPWDYLHINSSTADGNSYLVSGRRMSTIYRIDRATARIRWRLRGDGVKPKTNNFKIGPGAQFGYPHDVRRLSDGTILMFDNSLDRPQNNLPAINPDSSALRLRLSGKGKNRTATLVSRYRHPEGLKASNQGSARLQENGNMVVGWGGIPRLTEFTPEGEIAFDALITDAEIGSYRAIKAQWIGNPKDRPAIASEADGAGANVYASWNGATKVKTWKVYTGTGPDNLTEVATAPWSGLETMIPIPTVDTNVQVVAFDADGKQLKQSGLVPLGQQSR